MRSIPLTLTAVLALLPAVACLAADGSGLVPRRDGLGGAGWHGRMVVGATAPALASDAPVGEAVGQRVTGLTLIGDYYFGIAPRWDAGGGLRASGGLLWGSRPLLAGTTPLGLGRPALSVARHWNAAPRADAADLSTLPYVGLGYSGSLGTGRFGFSADLGLMAQSPGNAVRLGRVLGGSQSFDDVVRELRLAPVLQLGVSYAF